MLIMGSCIGYQVAKSTASVDVRTGDRSVRKDGRKPIVVSSNMRYLKAVTDGKMLSAVKLMIDQREGAVRRAIGEIKSRLLDLHAILS